MRLTRCHVPLPLQAGDELTLPEEALHHLVRVLRLRAGERCVLFNGDGCDYPAELIAVDRRAARVRILGATPCRNESPLAISLIQGIARGEKMDLILQKATELGAHALLPVHAERTEVRLEPARAAKRMAHWQDVVAAACAQCGRSRLPQLQAPQPLAEAVTRLPTDSFGLVLDPQGGLRLDELPADLGRRPLTLAIGPEGGWSEADLAVLAGAGFHGLRLGPRVLRTETAGLAAITALQARYGDLG